MGYREEKMSDSFINTPTPIFLTLIMILCIFWYAVMSRIFSKMEWDCSTKEDRLGSTMGLAENIMSYLGLTEDKTTELLSIQAFLNSKVNT